MSTDRNNPAIDPELQQAIIEHPSKDAKAVARELSTTLQRYVPTALVMKVRGSLQHAENITAAKQRASSELLTKLGVIDDVAADLLVIFNDELRPMKERLDAVKELRQYLKLGIEQAGIHDDTTETLFVIDSSWTTFGGTDE